MWKEFGYEQEVADWKIIKLLSANPSCPFWDHWITANIKQAIVFESVLCPEENYYHTDTV